ASEQVATPASFAISPDGRVVSIPVSCCVPSARASFSTKGEYAPALGLAVPASKLGWLGACASVGAQPSVIEELSLRCGVSPSGALQGVKSAATSEDPHSIPVFSGAAGPSKNSSRRSSKGSCGASATSAVNRPLWGSALIDPASLTTTPL